MPAAARSAELRPALAGGRALPAVRSTRVRVTGDGAVVLSTGAGAPRVLAGPGTVDRVLYRDLAADRLVPGVAYTGPVVVLVDRAGAALVALRVLDWAPPANSQERELLEVSGVRALAAALDLPVEPAEAGDLAALRDVRRALVRPLPPRPWPGRAATAAGVLALVLGLLGLVGAGEGAGAAATAATLLVAGSVVVSVHRARTAAVRLTATPAEQPGPVLRPRPDRAVPQGLLGATLRIGAEDVVLTDRGREVWLAGPARGGVSQVVIEPAVVRLADEDGRDHARLDTELWAPTPERQALLRDECTAAGLGAQVSPLPGGAYPVVTDLRSAGVAPRRLVTDTERGDPTVAGPLLAGLALATALVGALGAAAWQPAVGWPLLLVDLGLLVVQAVGALQRVRADRRMVRPVTAPEPAVVP